MSQADKDALIGAARTFQTQEYGKIDLEELKKTEQFIRAFEDLSSVGGMTLDAIYSDLLALSKQTGILPTDLKNY